MKTLTFAIPDDLEARLCAIEDHQGSWERGLLVALRTQQPELATEVLARHGRGDGGLNRPEMARLVLEVGLAALEALHLEQATSPAPTSVEEPALERGDAPPEPSAEPSGQFSRKPGRR